MPVLTCKIIHINLPLLYTKNYGTIHFMSVALLVKNFTQFNEIMQCNPHFRLRIILFTHTHLNMYGC